MAANHQSLREFDFLADRIRLNRQADKNPVVIVEGPTDKRLLSRAFHDQSITYFPAQTRSLAIKTAAQLHAVEHRYFTCVVDRDFDEAVEEARQNICEIYPYHNADLEAMLVVSKVGIDLLNELGSAEKIADKGGARKIMSLLGSIVEPISRLRRANLENKWGLAFDKVDLASKIDRKVMELKISSYCMAISKTSDSAPGAAILIEYAEGRQALKRTPACPQGSRPYVRGRDFLAVLGAALSGFCGTKRIQSVTSEQLAETLRLAGAYELHESEWGKYFLDMIKKEHRIGRDQESSS